MALLIVMDDIFEEKVPGRPGNHEKPYLLS